MALNSDVTHAVEAALIALAKRVEGEEVASYAAQYAQAANRLAEAYAWYGHPAHPHGGSVSVSS